MTPVTKPDSTYPGITFSDRILDSVHGYIELTPVERKIIELPIFKRLQSIKQLSLVNWVFPGAEHTRYTHSLGVMFLVDKMAIQLGFIDGDRQLIRLAGLLHDIGHYPLSHVGESAYKPSAEAYDTFIQLHINQTIQDINSIADSASLLHAGVIKDKPFHHEAIGARIIENSAEINGLIKKYCAFINPLHICDIITGKYSRFPELSAMIQLMHSELDADRMDYLLRDASFSGTSYGAVDTGIIIKNLTCKRKYGVDIVGIKPKGISATDQFLINRFFSKSQIICNRHVSALELMAQAVIRYVSEKEMFDFPKINNLLQYVISYESNTAFMKFTDHLFWNAVYALDKEIDLIKHPKYILDFAHMLAKHQEIKTITGSDITYSGLEQSVLFNSIVASQPYYNLSANSKGTFEKFLEGYNPPPDMDDNYFIQKAHIVTLTDNIPESRYDELFLRKNGDADMAKDGARKDNYKKYRLQDGLAVIDVGTTETDIHLLVDDHRSLVKSIFPLKVAILREYNIFRYEDELDAVTMSF